MSDFVPDYVGGEKSAFGSYSYAIPVDDYESASKAIYYRRANAKRRVSGLPTFWQGFAGATVKVLQPGTYFACYPSCNQMKRIVLKNEYSEATIVRYWTGTKACGAPIITTSQSKCQGMMSSAISPQATPGTTVVTPSEAMVPTSEDTPQVMLPGTAEAAAQAETEAKKFTQAGIASGKGKLIVLGLVLVGGGILYLKTRKKGL